MEARRTSKLAVKAAKEPSRQEFGERLESDYRSASKTFWQTIRRIRFKKVVVFGQVKSKNGTLLSNEKSILCRYREYFSEILNPVGGTEGGRFEVSVGSENIPSVVEVALAIESLKSGKSVGVKKIRPEMLKASGKEGIQRLSRVIKVAWQKSSVPKDWQIGVMVLIFKKGSRNDCPNYRGITLLSISAKVL